MKTCKKGHTFSIQKKCPICKKNWQDANKIKTSTANKNGFTKLAKQTLPPNPSEEEINQKLKDIEDVIIK